MNELLSSTFGILGESAPYLILGFALAGVLHVVLARHPGITARLTRPGRRSVLFGALIGVPMPLCSCSVLPAAMALRRDGASRGATASFLVSVPETDIVSILITQALIGPAMAIYRPLAAIAAALATGLAVDAIAGGRGSTRAAAASDPSCNCEPVLPAAPPVPVDPWWKRAARYGFVEIFDDILVQLLLGIALAAMIGAWLPAVDARSLGDGVALQYVVMAAIGVPLYVCAAASTPIAAGFIVAGISPGAALVFLLAGPATNVASLVVLRSEFGARFLAVYLASIIVTSVVLGALFDTMIGTLELPVTAQAVHAHDEFSPLRLLAVAVFGVLSIVSLKRTRALPRGLARLARLVRTRPGR